jgi:signal transduction histidine kinase
VSYALRIFAANLVASILVATIAGGVGFATPWRPALTALGISFLFSNCIGIPVALTLPRLGAYVWTRFTFPINWIIMCAVMMALALPGSALAIGLLIAAGVLAPADFGEWFAGSTRISILTTLTIGVAVTAYELMRTRLAEATLALRTKERDEAEARRLASEARLSSLEARVQPHFLFNTLNSISALIPRDPEGAERMTGQLASLMRSSLDDTGALLVPLSQELKVVRDYLEIERVRFGARLRYEVHADEHVINVMVPRLSLQTLVENSVKFAVSPRRDGASITIRARQEGGTLHVGVEDDGPGFDGRLPEGHGLALLKDRLELVFGGRASLNIQSAHGRTIVALHIKSGDAQSEMSLNSEL